MHRSENLNFLSEAEVTHSLCMIAFLRRSSRCFAKISKGIDNEKLETICSGVHEKIL